MAFLKSPQQRSQSRGFWQDTPESIGYSSDLSPDQQRFQQEYLKSLTQKGVGGAAGETTDYFRGLVSGEGDEAFSQPLMRQFNEDIMPGIAEQFAGLGSGGLSSGNFVQETGRAATDLSERIGQMRADLRQRGAEGLSGLVRGGMSPTGQGTYTPRQPSLGESFLTSFGPALATGLGTAVGGPIGGAVSNAMTNKFLTK